MWLCKHVYFARAPAINRWSFFNFWNWCYHDFLFFVFVVDVTPFPVSSIFYSFFSQCFGNCVAVKDLSSASDTRMTTTTTTATTTKFICFLLPAWKERIMSEKSRTKQNHSRMHEHTHKRWARNIQFQFPFCLIEELYVVQNANSGA